MICKLIRSRIYLSSVLFAAPLLLQGCFSQYHSIEQDALEMERHQARNKGGEGGSEAAPAPKIADERLFEYISNNADLSMPWRESSAEVIAQLNTYETRTKLQEAALVVGILRLYFQQLPMEGGGSPTGEKRTLKVLAEASAVNIGVAFAANPYLKTHEIVALALKILPQVHKEDQDYAQQMEIPIRALLARWQKLGSEQEPAAPAPELAGSSLPDKAVAPATPEVDPGAVPVVAAPVVAAPVVATPVVAAPGVVAPPPEPAQPEPQPQPQPSPAPQQAETVAAVGEEAVLREAQTLIDQASYQEAINRLQQLSPQSPYHAAATEKARGAKNLAVQDLRKKAATAFQSSMPVNDAKAKGAYLKEAEGYLEQAMNLYPDAEQIETVKENLNVIKKNIAQLETTTQG